MGLAHLCEVGVRVEAGEKRGRERVKVAERRVAAADADELIKVPEKSVVVAVLGRKGDARDA